MIKLLLITWSYEKFFDIQKTFIYKSFIKKNNNKLIVHKHFDRNEHSILEKEFESKFGNQYEYILYKIFLLLDEVKKIDSEYIIYSDTNDVVCLDNIQNINLSKNEKVLFSKEIHQYPSQDTISNWNIYPNKNNRSFLNSGLYFGKKENIINLLQYCINHVLPLKYKNFGGDQGVFTYAFLNSPQKIILLDEDSKYFLSTYLRSEFNYIKKENKIIDKESNTEPFFIHDNGWNYGSPKFIEKFSLI